MIGVHHSKSSSHPGNMRAAELALLNYKEYCGTSSHLVKRAFAAKLIKRLDNEGRRFLRETSNGWMTMTDEQTLKKISVMMCTLNSGRGGRVKVKPAKSAVKLNKKNWNDDDCKTLREYITEKDVDDMFMWGRVAKMLNRSESACKFQWRKFLDCGIYGEEKESELIVFLYCFNFKINRLICGVLCALALLRNLVDTIPSTEEDIPRAFRLEALIRQDGLTKDFSKSLGRGFNGVHFSPVPPDKLSFFDRDKYMLFYADSVHEIEQEQLMVLEELNGHQCIMPDLMVRDIHNYDPESGGAPIPHILLDQANDVWRDDVHNCVYLCNDVVAAAWKFRYAKDRWTKYGRENGPFSESGYMYLVSPENSIRSGFRNMGLGFNESPGHESIGKSRVPVTISGCYKVTWNGSGICNAVFTWIPM